MLTHAFTDVLKGSYYANPLIDVPTVSAQDAKLYPEYYGKNICECTAIRMDGISLKVSQGPKPDEKGVEGFEEAFKDLGR